MLKWRPYILLCMYIVLPVLLSTWVLCNPPLLQSVAHLGPESKNTYKSPRRRSLQGVPSPALRPGHKARGSCAARGDGQAVKGG